MEKTFGGVKHIPLHKFHATIMEKNKFLVNALRLCCT